MSDPHRPTEPETAGTPAGAELLPTDRPTAAPVARAEIDVAGQGDDDAQRSPSAGWRRPWSGCAARCGRLRPRRTGAP
ncbi:hypothetical protein KJK32_01720 [Streptomyces sp. JCM17656]|nr:hypothetical protein KJK32_01720 [Streptomyces sp. JCM17656]